MHRSDDQGRALARSSVALALAASVGCLLIWFAANRSFRITYVEEILTDLESDARALSALVEQTAVDHDRDVALRAAARLSPSISHDGIPVDLWLVDGERAVRFSIHNETDLELDLSDGELVERSVGANRTFAEIVETNSRAAGVWAGADGVRRLIAVQPVSALTSALGVTVPMESLEGRLRAQAAPWTAGMGFIALLVIPLAFTLLHTAYGRATRRSLTYARQLEEVTSTIPAVVFQAVATPQEPGLRYVFVSELVRDLFGVTPDEVINNAELLQGRFHPDDLPLIRRAAARALSEHVPMHIDHRIIHEDGSIRWLRVQSTPRVQDDGCVIWTGVATDVTEQKVTELALLRTQAAVDHAGDAVFWINRAGRFLYVNEAACRSLGLGRDALLKLNVSDIDPDHPAEAWNELWDAVRQRERVEFRSRHRAADGRVFPVEIRSNFLDFENEQIICAYAREITEAVRAQTELEQREREFRLLADNVPAMFTYIDVDGRYRFVNKGYVERFQLGSEALIGKRYSDVLGDTVSDVIEGFVKRALRGERVEFEVPIRYETVGTRWMSATYVPNIVEGEVAGFFALITDVTESKAAEQHLVETNETLQLLLSELDHRVKNSLSGLLSLINLSSQQDTDVPRFASAIRQRIGAMAAAHTLLSNNQWSPIALREIIDTLVPGEARGRVAVAGPGVLVPAAQVTALGMVIQELLTNSVKYGALGAGGVVEVSWQSSPGKSGQTIVDLRWRETGGPTLPHEQPPERLGMQLIQGFVTTELRGSAELTYPREGADHRLRITLGSTDHASADESGPQGAAGPPSQRT